jgi:anti-sigma factor RsiW
MNCDFVERWAALAASNDLGEQEQTELAAHLDQCESCRAAAAEFSRIEADLAALKDERVDPAVYTAIREGVLDRIPHGSNWRIAAALALAAALILMASVIWRDRRGQIALPLQPPRLQVSAPPVPAVVPVVEHPPKSIRGRHRGVERSPAPEHPLVVKMLTDDPDVVIIWLVDRDEKEIAR